MEHDVDAVVLACRGTLAGWSLEDGALEKMFRFADWRSTMAFVNAISEVANAVDHHPDAAALGWERAEGAAGP